MPGYFLILQLPDRSVAESDHGIVSYLLGFGYERQIKLAGTENRKVTVLEKDFSARKE